MNLYRVIHLLEPSTGEREKGERREKIHAIFFILLKRFMS